MIAIVDYGMGNRASVRNALTLLGKDPVITDTAEDLSRATHIILPGVGAFGDGMSELRRRNLVQLLNTEVVEKKKPLLGICLGMQLLGSVGEEGGIHDGLGLVPGRVRRLSVDEQAYRLPHIGWNTVEHTKNPLFEGIPTADFYFVHSYVLVPEVSSHVIATTDYGERCTVAVRKNNVWGVQFHPEKSQTYGLKLLENFSNI